MDATGQTRRDSYRLVCIQQALLELQYPDLYHQSKKDGQKIKYSHIITSGASSITECTYLVPGHGLCSEERAGQLHGQTLLVVLRFVLGHAEQHSCRIRS